MFVENCAPKVHKDPLSRAMNLLEEEFKAWLAKPLFEYIDYTEKYIDYIDQIVIFSI